MEKFPYAFPPYCLISAVPTKLEKGKDQYDIDESHLTNPSIVLPTIDKAHSKNSFDTKPKRLVLRTIGKSSSLNIKSETSLA